MVCTVTYTGAYNVVYSVVGTVVYGAAQSVTCRGGCSHILRHKQGNDNVVYLDSRSGDTLMVCGAVYSGYSGA